MIPGQGQVFPVSPAVCQDTPAPDWAATRPPETPRPGSPEVEKHKAMAHAAVLSDK